MEYEMISNLSIAVFISMIIIGIAMPITLVAVWKIKTKQSIKVILTGAATFFVFAIVLESLPKLVLFQTNNPVGKFVMSNTFLYITSVALLAGIFEETGRLVAYKFFLKKHNERLTSITYGIGHGGFEAIYLLAVVGGQYLAYAILINQGQFETIVAQVAASAPNQLNAINAIPKTLAATTFFSLILSVIERVSAVIIHISCSIIMFKAVKEKGKLWLYPLAILLHASIDLFAGLYQTGLITNLYVVEGCLLIWAIFFFAICMKLLYKKMPETYQTI